MSSLPTDDEKIRALEQLRSRFADLLEPRHDDRFLLRWLRARDFNVDAAEKMLREDFNMRKKIGVDTILESPKIRPELQPYIADMFLGFDNEGSSVHFFCASADYKGFVRSATYSDLLKYFIHIYESNTRLMKENNLKTGKDAEKMTYIVDVSLFRINQWLDKRVIRQAMGALSYYTNHYPETLNVAYVVNVSSAFFYIFNILKRCLNDVILRKIKLYPVGDESWSKEVFATIPKEIVPAYLGGERYGPDAMCSAFIARDIKIPTELYLTDMNTLKTSDPNVQEIEIRERSVFEIEKNIEKTDSVLCWEFQTKNYNIKFGLFYKMKQHGNFDTEDREELIPVESVNCNDFIEKAEYECKKPGTYILHFDNSYSWFRPKHLLYKVEVNHLPITNHADLSYP